MAIYNIANQLTGLIEAIMSFVLFEVFLTKRKRVPKYLYLMGIVCLAALIDLSNGFFNIGFLNYAVTVAAALCISFMYKGSFKMRLLASVLSFILSALAEITVLLCMSVFLKQDTDIIVGNTEFRLIGIAVSKIIAIIAVLYIRRRANKELELLDTGYWFLFTVICVTATVNI